MPARTMRPRFSLPQYQAYLRRVSAPPQAGLTVSPQMIRQHATPYDQMNLPPGSFVVFRADIDGREDSIFPEKLASNLPFLQHAIERGWNVIMLGHRRRPSVDDSAAFFNKQPINPMFLHSNDQFSNLDYLRRELCHPIGYIRYWLNEVSCQVSSGMRSWLLRNRGKQGQIVLLENDRLWPALYSEFNAAAKEAADGETRNFNRIARAYYNLGTQFLTLGVRGYVFDAISAAKQACGSKSAFAPFMSQIGVGPSTLSELEAIEGLLEATDYYVGGSKVDEKIPSVLRMMREGKIRLIITGGIVGFALRYAELIHRGVIKENHSLLGALADPSHPLHISTSDVAEMLKTYQVLEEQDRMDTMAPLQVTGGFLNPVDWRSADDIRRIVSFESGYGVPLRSDEAQFDIGPQSIDRISSAFRQIGRRAGSSVLVISGTPGNIEAGYRTGMDAFGREANRLLEFGGRVIGTGSEGNLVCPRGEHVIAGGVSGMFASGATPAAFRVLLPDIFPVIGG